jgi:hypothetical protein
MFKRRFVNGRKTSFTSFALILVCLFSFSLFMGCTGSDTFIIQNTKLQKLFDANIVGSQGLVPFISVDGNALEVQSGFDFNSDTNTLSVQNYGVSSIGKFFVDVNGDWVYCDNNSGC